jgi:hypothetical protein
VLTTAVLAALTGLLEELASCPDRASRRDIVLGWLGFAVGVIGLALAWKWRPRPPRPVFQSQGFKIIESGGIKSFDEGIEVTYKGQPVPLLTSSILVFWNDGLGPIKKDDIVDTDPIRCYVRDGARMLRTTVRSVSNENIGFKKVEREERPNEVELKFDHLNARDGVVLEILHTSDELRPKVAGSIIGGSGSGTIVDLGPIREAFPLPAEQEAKAKAYLWTFEVARQRVRIPWSALGWIIFLAVDAIAAILFVRGSPGAFEGDAQSWPYVAKVLVYMMMLPVVVAIIVFILGAIPYLFMTFGQLRSRRRRFPRQLDIWR